MADCNLIHRYVSERLNDRFRLRIQLIRTVYAGQSFDYCTLSQRTNSSRESVEVVHLCFFQGLRSRSAAVSHFPPGLFPGYIRVARTIFTRSPRLRLQLQGLFAVSCADFPLQFRCREPCLRSRTAAKCTFAPAAGILPLRRFGA